MQPHAIRGSRSALLLLSALLVENFLGSHLASLEHNASSARAGPSHSGCKGKTKKSNIQTIWKNFKNLLSLYMAKVKNIFKKKDYHPIRAYHRTVSVHLEMMAYAHFLSCKLVRLYTSVRDKNY